MTEAIVALAALPASAVVAMIATARILPWLERRRIVDVPNDRSSHATPTLRGGGWGMLVVIVPALWLAGSSDPLSPWRTCALACAGLAWCSWIDDRRGLNPIVRLMAQAIAVAIVLAGFDRPIFPGLPIALDRALAGLGLLWFLNLYNFMDGIDGLAASEAVAIALGAALLAILGPSSHLPPFAAAAIAGAALGFLRWNWSPARVFMGDVGSVPLGFTLGFVLIILAADGRWPAALVLPAYFVVDATLTLSARLLTGKRAWEAHRDHFYQRAVASGRGHARVTMDVTRANVALVFLALASFWLGWWVLPVAAWVVWRLLDGWRRTAIR